VEEKTRTKKDIESARQRLKALEESEAKSDSEDDVAEQGHGGDG
jgi:hypothetical protein